MKRPIGPLRSFCHFHLFGLLIGYGACQAMADLADVEVIVPSRLGFEWQANLIRATPILCVIGCIVVFVKAPVGNHSQYGLVRRIGAIPVLGRYWLYAGVVCGLVLLELLLLNLYLSSSVESLKLSGDVSATASFSTQIEQEVGDGVAFGGRGGETQIFFLKEKRAAVLHAIEKAHATVKQ